MTVKSVYAIEIPRLSYWLENLAPVFQPIRRETKNTKNNHTLHARFFPALIRLQVITGNCDWFITLFAPVVIGWSNYLA